MCITPQTNGFTHLHRLSSEVTSQPLAQLSSGSPTRMGTGDSMKSISFKGSIGIIGDTLKKEIQLLTSTKKIIIQNKRNKLFDCTRHACKYTIRIAFESYKIFKFIIKVQNILSCNNTQCQPVEGPQQHQQPHHSAGHQSRLAANNHQLGFTQQQRQRPHQYLHRQPRQQGGQCPVSSVRIMLWEI